MSNTNSKLATQAAVLESPLAFTSTSAAATVADANTTTAANIDSFIALVSLEGADQSVKRLYLDEMSPAARLSVYKILKDLRAATGAA